MKNTIKLYFNSLKLSFKLSFKASTFITFLRIVVMIVSSFVPIINAEAMKNIINNISIGEEKGAIQWLTILGITQILSAVIGKIVNYLSSIHSDKISLIISKDIIEKVNELDISYFDNPKLYDELSNVTRDIQSIPNLIWIVFSSIQIIIKLCSASLILANYIWWSPIIIILSCLPNFIIDKKNAIKMYEWNRDTINDTRKMNYSYSTLTSKYFSKDIRLYQLKDYLYNKYSIQWKQWHSKKHQKLTKNFVSSFITMFLPNIVTLIFAALIMMGVFQNRFLLGDFSYYISIMSQLTTSVFGVIAIFSDIIAQKIKIEYYNAFKLWTSKVDTTGKDKLDSIEEIEFENVTFSYPNTKTIVLSDVSFKVKKGEKIGIVGKNGSGKTTLIKLLLRLYEPTKGKILVNGKDIKSYDIKDYYQLTSSLMQDYINYSFSLKENIATADIDFDLSSERIIKACECSDCYDFVKKWEKGIDEYLTKSFDESGKELSGGQWQKIALARFFYKKAALAILDEPSSSIDIESEKRIFNHLFENCDDNILILISHRLSNLNNMNKIIVMDEGKIVEKGTHVELINKKSMYYKLYEIQKNKFNVTGGT